MAPASPLVVLVATDRKNHERYARVLGDAEVEISKNAASAGELLQTRDVALIITDHVLPRFDGFAVARAIRTRNAAVPILVMSQGTPKNDDMLRAFESRVLHLSHTAGDRALTRAIRDQLTARPPARPLRAQRVALREIPATTAKNEFGRVLDAAIEEGRVVISKHQRPHAVVLAFAEYERLLSKAEPSLDELTHDFDLLLARMQTPQARAAADALFSMAPAELGHAAVASAEKK